ncbi:MAG TPA: Ig-like domain-containing protein, partial [Candidatus Avimonoglobus intestinipullorum]|nr:Ig-like domain-containing protein [Candidatus Avimonoglobus intestinipullorum]
MRKSKGIIALAAAVTMLLTAIQPVGFAADDPVSIVIPGKSATAVEYTYDGETYRNDNEKYVQWANDKTYGETNMHISSRISPLPDGNYQADVTKFSDGITLEYTVNIEEAGVYQLDISGSDVTHMYRSAYAVAMDDLEFKAINVLNSEVTDLPPANADGLYKHYATPFKYDLEAGQHTFKVKLLGKAANAEKLQYDAYINIITFNKTTDTAVNDIYIHGLDAYSAATEGLSIYRDANGPEVGGTQTGSAAMMRTPDGVFADGGYVVTYPFTVTEAGAYRVTGLGANDQGAEWLSKNAISIDDAPYTKMIDMRSANNAYPITATHMRDMQVNKRYWLTEGTHYLNFWIYEERNTGDSNNDNNAYAYFDYIKLTREEATDGSFSVYGTDDSTNNFASLPEAWQGITNQYVISGKGTFANVGDHPEYDGKVMSVVASATQEEFPESGIEVDYPFYVEKTGWYQLDVAKNNNGGWFSPLELGVDGALSAFAQGSSAHITAETKLDGNYTNYQTDLQYYLEEGLHTFNFKLTGIAPDRGSTLAFLAEAKFTPVPEEDLPTELQVKAKDPISEIPAEVAVVTDTMAEAGSNTAVRFRTNPGFLQEPGVDVVYPFNVYVSGTYTINTVAGGNLSHGSLSDYTIGIDDTMFDLESSITGETSYGINDLLRIYETNLTCNLTAGVHYLTFRIENERPEGGAYAFFDYVDLELEEEPELNLEIADEYVEKGGSTYVTLTSVNPRTGAVVDEVYESVTYSSSDTSVATVEQDRTVTAVGPGKAAIIADVVRQNGEEERVSVDIKVTVNALYCEVDGFTLDGEALTELTGGTHSVGAKVNIQNNELFPGKATIVFAVYAGNTLKGIEVVSDNAVEGFYTTPYELTLDNFDMDGVTQLSVMVWNDIGDLQPI